VQPSLKGLQCANRIDLMSRPYALVADIGGTHARFAVADPRQAAPLLTASVRHLAVKDFASLIDAAHHYLAISEHANDCVGQGVLAVAGRVDGDLVQITNHPWLISRSATADALQVQLSQLHLINDFKAQALATELLTGDDLVAIGCEPRAPESNSDAATFAVIGPGTGLGVGGLIIRDGIGHALETEGGHVGFAPTTHEEAAVLARLLQRYGRVSNERLLSGSGLGNIHWALATIAGEHAAEPLPPQTISASALAGDPLCQRAVNLFCEVFGSIAGDLVLTLGAWDGVFLTGGLVPKLLAPLQRSTFRQRFEAKGRFAASMARVPTLAITHPHAGLLGAAALATRLATRR